MNLFGVGEIELVLILLIALIVAGPKRMIQWAYLFGRFLRHLRGMWSEAVVVIQKEIDDAGLDVQVPTHIPTRGEVHNIASQVLKPLSDPLQAAADEVKQVGVELQTTATQARDALDVSAAPVDATPAPSAPKPATLYGSWSGLKAQHDIKPAPAAPVPEAPATQPEDQPSS